MNSAAPSTKPRRAWLRILLGLVFVLFAVSAVLALLLVVDRIRTRAEWNEYTEAARARGQKLLLPEYVKPPIPDAENFAAVPLFEKVFASGEPDEALLLLPGKAPKLSEEDRRFDLQAWHAYFVREKLLPSDSATPDAAAMLQALDARFGAEWQQLREAAKRPDTRFPVKWEKGFSAGFPHLRVLQKAARLSALRLQLQLELKNGAAAHDEWLFGWRITEALRDEPVLICFLVRAATMQMSLDGVRAGIAAGVWDDVTLQKIQAQVGTARVLEGYLYAVDSERGGLNTIFDRLGSRRADGDLQALLEPSGLRFAPQSFFFRNRLFSNRYTDETLARIDLAQERFRGGRREFDPDQFAQSRVQRVIYSMSMMLNPVFDRVEKSALSLHTQVQAATVACAMERQRLARGGAAALPQTLDQLVPEFIPRVPLDVMDGQPLRYRTRGDGTYLLYSIGENGVDDGGAFDPKVSLAKNLDWTWRSLPAAAGSPP